MIAAASWQELPPATAGTIAVANLESSRERSWYVLSTWPDRSGTAKRIVEEELHRVQYLGDTTALDRLANLSLDLCHNRPFSEETHIIAAQVSSMRHCFADAKLHLQQAEAMGAPLESTRQMWLTIRQATGDDLQAVLEERKELVAATGGIQGLVPLAALLAELGEYEDSERVYLRAISQYRDVSPFPLAWVCFQLGMLWGEIVPKSDRDRAKYWYQRAVDYIAPYTHARVHLAEIHLLAGELDTAEALLRPILDSGDPEVQWRYSEVLAAQDRAAEADRYRIAASSAFGSLLARHELAFADHGAEYFLSIGADPKRASKLAEINLANRPTLRAFELAHAAAIANADQLLAEELQTRAHSKFGNIKAFNFSSLSESGS